MENSVLEVQKTVTRLSLFTAAQKYLAAGYSVIPVRLGDKRPNLDSWEEYQTRLPAIAEITHWFSVENPLLGIAIVNGAISGNLSTIDFDFRGAFAKRFWAALKARSLPLCEKLTSYIERSKGGGFHLPARCSGKMPGNEKWAYDVKEVPSDSPKGFTYQWDDKQIAPTRIGNKKFACACMIETRGEGGYVVVYPSTGYDVKAGEDFTSTCEVTPEEWSIIREVGLSLCERQKLRDQLKVTQTKDCEGKELSINVADIKTKFKLSPDAKFVDGESPFDAYRRDGAQDFKILLTDRGWSFCGLCADGEYWTRPGKTDGVSGILFDNGSFFCFTTNAPDMDGGTGYSWGQLYAKWKFEGDEGAAARDLLQKGFGKPGKLEMPLESPTGTAVSDALGIASEVVPLEAKEPPADLSGLKLIPQAPSDEEMLEIYRGTAWQTMVDESRKIAPITPLYSIITAMVLQSAIMAPCVTIRSKKANCYGMMVGEQSSGKSTMLNALTQCLGALGLKSIPKSSAKTYLKSVANNPWGTLTVGEFGAYVDSDWLGDAVHNINDGYDGIEISEASEKTGKIVIRNAGPSMLACIQTQKFLKFGMKAFVDSGLFARAPIAIFERQSKPFVRLGQTSENVLLDVRPVLASFQQSYSWLPPPMRPAKEETWTEVKGDKESVVGKGEWTHPIAGVNMTVEPFENLWQTHYFPEALLAPMQRLVPNTLPLLAIPFCDRGALLEYRITADAMARAERVLLGFYHNLARLLQIVPDNDRGELLIRAIIRRIQKGPEDRSEGAWVSKQVIRKSVSYDNNKAFEDAISVIVGREMVNVRTHTNDNKSISTWYSLKDPKGEKLTPFSPIVLKSIPEQAGTTVGKRVPTVDEEL